MKDCWEETVEILEVNPRQAMMRKLCLLSDASRAAAGKGELSPGGSGGQRKIFSAGGRKGFLGCLLRCWSTLRVFSGLL